MGHGATQMGVLGSKFESESTAQLRENKAALTAENRVAFGHLRAEETC